MEKVSRLEEMVGALTAAQGIPRSSHKEAAIARGKDEASIGSRSRREEWTYGRRKAARRSAPNGTSSSGERQTLAALIGRENISPRPLLSAEGTLKMTENKLVREAKRLLRMRQEADATAATLLETGGPTSSSIATASTSVLPSDFAASTSSVKRRRSDYESSSLGLDEKQGRFRHLFVALVCLDLLMLLPAFCN